MLRKPGYVLRRLLRATVPSRIRFWLSRLRGRRARYNTGPVADIFSAIYRDGLWGSGDEFYSGLGSHADYITKPYVAAVARLLSQIGAPIDAVDLGCGDFAVGSQVRRYCDTYTACDVVPSLIERNRARFADMDVDFEIVNLIDDILPPVRIAFIRQVLQHLSNEQIAMILPKLHQYEYLVVTEHLPTGDFVANLDKAAGPMVRTEKGSGVDLGLAPFNLVAARREVLCSVTDADGTVVTTLYQRPGVAH